ncbi:MAG: 2-C-methyl-D-erythritol 2,4-cyclodiphosphate synthase [Burkholderiales bacterium]|nr:2-C-methyl-D-erythritol 2,4-cyclodiphosphate synthase [Burkholderiales bacterium]
MRIGHGFDVHAFSQEVNQSAIRLGGVDIPFERNLKGHSDADVALHAITDALFGAMALGDLGQFYPDSDEQWRNADSGEFLRRAILEVRSLGYRVINVDVTILAQRPQIAPYREAMREAIAESLGCVVGRVSVKATTTEGLGFVGREEGIAAHAVVLLMKINAFSE